MATQHELYDCDDVGLISNDLSLSPVVFARGRDEASRYCTVLEEVNIPALVVDEAGVGGGGFVPTPGTPVLVPEFYHERASEIIALHDAINSIGDDEDDDDDEFDDDDEDDEEDEDEDEDDDDDWDE